MDNLSLNITELRTHIEELEKRIKAISMQVTVGTQISAVKACIEEIRILVENYQTSYNAFIENYKAHTNEFNTFKQQWLPMNEQLNSIIKTIETLEQTTQENSDNLDEHLTGFESLKQQLNSLNLEFESQQSILKNTQTNVENLSENLSEHLSDFSDHKIGYESFKQSTNSNLQNLAGEVENLKNSTPAPSMGGQIIAFEDFDYSNDSFCCMNAWQFISPYYFIKAQKSQYLTVEMSFDLVHTTTSTITPKFYVYVNNKEYHYEVFTPPDEQTHHHSYKFRILLESTNTTFYTKVIKGSDKSSIQNFNITFRGLDLIVNPNDKLINITCFNNQYYICTRQTPDKCKFVVLEKDALSLDPTDLPHFYYGAASSLDNNSTRLHPRTVIGDAVLTQDNTYSFPHTVTLLNMFSNFQLIQTHRQTNTISGEVANILARDFYESNYITKYDYVPYGNGSGGYSYVVTRFDGIPLYKFSGMSKLEPLTYNGEQLSDVYNCCLVKNNNLCYGDNAPEYAGAILWHSDNTCYYYPNINSTQRVEVGKGRICSAYIQPDNSINVYLNQGSEVYKYRLIKTSNGTYQNSGLIKTFSGITSYEELLDGKSLVAKFKNFEIWDLDPE